MPSGFHDTPAGIVDPACPMDWSHPLNRGMVARLKVVPNSGWRGGLTFRDLTRGGRAPQDGTLTNGATWAGPGRPNNYGSILLDGSNDQINIPHSNAINFGSTMTWGITFRNNGTLTSYASLMNKTSSVAWDDGPVTYFLNSGGEKLLAGTRDGNTASTSFSFTDQSWHTVIYTCTPSTLQIYLDGKPGTSATPSPNAFGTPIWKIGNAPGGAPFPGYVDDIFASNIAFTAAEAYQFHLEMRRGSPETLRWIGARTYSFPPQAAGGGGTTVTPTTLALTLTRYAPSVSTPRLVTPGALALTITKYAPLALTPRLVTPSTLSLTLTKFAPTIVSPRLVTPSTLALTVAVFAPTVAAPRLVTPVTRSLTISAFAPIVSTPRTVTPSTRSLTISAFAPTVSTPRIVTPSTKALVLSAFAPTVSMPRLVTPATLAMTTTKYAPSVNVGQFVTPGVRSLVTTSFAPTVLTPSMAIPSTLAMALTGFAPIVSASGQSLCPIAIESVVDFAYTFAIGTFDFNYSQDASTFDF